AEEDSAGEEAVEDDIVIFEEETNPVTKHSQMALKNVKVKPSKLVPEAPLNIKQAQQEEIPETPAKQIDKIQVEADESSMMHIDEELQSSETIAPNLASSAESEERSSIEISLRQVFGGAPIIYTLLSILSIISLSIWSYSMLTIRSSELLPKQLIKDLKSKLISNQFTDALHLCQKEKHFFCKMVATGILARKQGLGMMVEMMKAEGKRSTVGFWQRLNLLNDIAIIAPMLGLLGTVMGMFYAFYDLHRSSESLSILFDGLGISVGTTIAGLIVAIIAMILHSTAKYRLIKALASLENEAQGIAALIETKGPSYLET
ncbi:MAG TPA: MotA/TolQ/ExbB proton channel family protein, partial [Rhabdochlamydiaceae bacterium]|nr:MotA/TolQ/ExbB proton channel family protein [Rhabdochlamydiaceae bacterium]